MSSIPPGVGTAAFNGAATPSRTPPNTKLDPAQMNIEELKSALIHALLKEEKEKILAELLKKLEESGSVKGGQGDRLSELMAKFMSGTISASEIKELAQALGVSEKVLQMAAQGGGGMAPHKVG